MARPTDINKYPKLFWEMADKLQQHPEQPVRIECADMRDAHNLRLWIYAFRKAALAAGLEKTRLPGVAYLTVRLESVSDKVFIVVYQVDSAPDFVRWAKQMENVKAEE
jgi:hypothetical protein